MPTDDNYHNYGGRGICVCAEWAEFSMFRDWAEANGYADGLTIDRKNNNGHYEPDNCRWVPMVVQANNTRRNVFVEAFGDRKTVSQWTRDDRCRVSDSILRRRLKDGWSHEMAISTPSASNMRISA